MICYLLSVSFALIEEKTISSMATDSMVANCFLNSFKIIFKKVEIRFPLFEYFFIFVGIGGTPDRKQTDF